jgi:hypothetical protein
VAAKWATVTVTDPDGRRHNLDVQATSTSDAAHLFVVEAKKERAVGLPKVTLATVFEVVTDGKVYRVRGEALQRWIVERRQIWQGPKGFNRNFDIEKKPLQSIGLVAGALVAIVYWKAVIVSRVA